MKSLSEMNKSTEKYYKEKAKEFFDGTVNVNMEDLYRPFLELIPVGGKILDAGCGSGRDALYFKQQGYSVIAFDYSEELVRLASSLINSPVLHRSFDDIVFNEEFDGIWACASILHVSKRDIGNILKKLTNALKINGILYTSFKYGDVEKIRNGRLFNDYTESSFQKVLNNLPALKKIKFWKTVDARPGRKDEFWLNVLLRKIA